MDYQVLLNLMVKFVLPCSVVVSAGNELGSGRSLVGMKPAALLLDRQCYLVSLIRLILCPLITLVVVRFLQLAEPVATISVIMSGLPSGSVNVIMAKEYDCEADFAARSVVQTMVLSVITVLCVIFLCTIF